ncbi:ATP-binding cassette domain-containing protein [Myxacorys almedinensis A]|uniref:ATP-binding cassette domain-containing protein n=2 Tax=Myxacorys TaxID=2056239 RepID=A0A8J8CJE5_9CYAN|nr:ATP-binding cassette domain-containing protein [Myxacorys almedinensis A]
MGRITKRFPGVIANQAIALDVKAGEIHALLGENGAGKTTLMNLLCGLYEPDEGEIRIFGQLMRFRSPKDAIAAGIGMVHQHFRLVESFTVAENIILGQTKGLWRDSPQRLHAHLQTLAHQYSLTLDFTARIWQLSVGEQQRVEILKALYRRARVLILDEPTAVLTPQEAQDLMATLRHLAAQGTAIIFISHKLKEVMALCDRVTVLRDGQRVGTVAVPQTTEQELAQMMVGRTIKRQRRTDPPERLPQTEPALILKQLSVMGDRQHLALRAIDLAIYPGEIVGIAGVDGNGQRELEEAIAGLRPFSQGELWRTGNLAHIPSDRYSMGLLTEFSIAENLVLRDVQHPPFQWRGLLRLAWIRKYAVDLVQRYLIRTPSVQTRAGNLSGGNAQKVVFARELTRHHQVLLAAQPTRGLDISATEFVHAQMVARRDAGTAVLLISTELEEILCLSDRIAVLYEGRIVGMMDGASADVHQLGLMMAGKTAVGHAQLADQTPSFYPAEADRRTRD